MIKITGLTLVQVGRLVAECEFIDEPEASVCSYGSTFFWCHDSVAFALYDRVSHWDPSEIEDKSNCISAASQALATRAALVSRESLARKLGKVREVTEAHDLS